VLGEDFRKSIGVLAKVSDIALIVSPSLTARLLESITHARHAASDESLRVVHIGAETQLFARLASDSDRVSSEHLQVSLRFIVDGSDLP
jgi:hypothetical protein